MNKPTCPVCGDWEMYRRGERVSVLMGSYLRIETWSCPRCHRLFETQEMLVEVPHKPEPTGGAQ